MTRKHFIIIAATVAHIADPDTRKHMTDTWVAVLSGENPRFDAAKFRAACGVTA